LRPERFAHCCRFPPLVLSGSGSRNIEFLIEYSEKNGIHTPCQGSKKGTPAHASFPEDKDFFNEVCPSLRWRYPDQVQPVGGE